MNNWPITVTAWFKTSSTTGSPGIVNKYVSASSNGWQLFMYNGGLCAWYFSNVTHFINNDGSGNCNPGPGGVTGYNNNTWHHAAFVVDASGGWLYVDGALKSAVGWSGGSPTGFQPSTTQPINIGRYGTAYFPGLIDDVRIYNRALTAAEVSAVYSGLNVAYVTSTDNSVYAINTNTGSQVFPKWVSGTTLWGGPAVWLTAVKPSVAICGVKTDVVFVGTRIVGAATNKVYALNGSNAAVTTSVTGGLCPVVNTVVQAGNPIWTYTGTNMYYITSTPYVDYANSAVWVTSRANASTANPSVWMFNVSNGNPINSWTGIGDIDADPTPTADGSVMYVGNTSGALWALKTTSPYTNYASYTPATGAGGLKSIPWPVGSGMPDTIIFSRNATVHMVTFTGSAFDSSSTPGKYWNLAPSGAPTVVSAPVDDGAGNVYVGDNNGKLHRIVISSGTEAVTSPVSAPVAAILGDPSYDVTNNLIYIGASDGHIYAFTSGF